jgi:hypothetical protein
MLGCADLPAEGEDGGTINLALADRDSDRDCMGYPLSVLGSRMGFGTEPGWLVAIIGV